MKKLILLFLLLTGFEVSAQQTYWPSSPSGWTAIGSPAFRFKANTPDSTNSLLIFNPLTGKYNQVYTAVESNKRFLRIADSAHYITPSYFNTHLPASLTYNNGLTKTGSTVKLGGDLTQETHINLNGNPFIIGGNMFVVDTVSGNANVTISPSYNGTYGSGNSTVGVYSDVGVQISNLSQDKVGLDTISYQSFINAGNGGAINLISQNQSDATTRELNMSATDELTYTNRITHHGISYASSIDLSTLYDSDLIAYRTADSLITAGVATAGIQNQISTPQTSANFWIDGSGIATNGFLAGDPTADNAQVTTGGFANVQNGVQTAHSIAGISYLNKSGSKDILEIKPDTISGTKISGYKITFTDTVRAYGRPLTGYDVLNRRSGDSLYTSHTVGDSSLNIHKNLYDVLNKTTARANLDVYSTTQVNAAIAAVASTIPVGGNPTATAGLNAVNGTSLAWMRADAAPKVDSTVFKTNASATTDRNNLITRINAFTQSSTNVVTNKDLTSGTNTFPTLNQSTTGSAATWTTARTLAGNSVNGSANVPFTNKFIVQGTSDGGLSAAQFMGALGTGLVKNTTTTGLQSIAVAGTDYVAPVTGTAYYAPLGENPLGELGTTNDPNGANVIAVVKFYLPFKITVNSLKAFVTTLAASSTIQLGVYSYLGTSGGALLCSTATISSTTTGLKSASTSATILQPGFYWAAYVASVNTVKVRGIANNGDTWSDNTVTGSATNTVSGGAMPATLGTISGYAGGNAPIVMLSN